MDDRSIPAQQSRIQAKIAAAPSRSSSHPEPLPLSPRALAAVTPTFPTATLSPFRSHPDPSHRHSQPFPQSPRPLPPPLLALSAVTPTLPTATLSPFRSHTRPLPPPLLALSAVTPTIATATLSPFRGHPDHSRRHSQPLPQSPRPFPPPPCIALDIRGPI